MKNYPMPRDAAEQIIRIILHAQEHQGPTGNTVDTFSVCSHECELQVTKVLARAEAHTSSLRKLASTILQAVRDTRRLPIVACMYFVAQRRRNQASANGCGPLAARRTQWICRGMV